jgi:hypothetical protein
MMKNAENGRIDMPLEASNEMIDAGVSMALCVSVHGYGGWSNYIAALYKTMVEAEQRSRSKTN